MKKLLVVLLMACGVPITCLSQETQFKHLNRLPEFSEIRKECGGVSRAWFYRGNLECQCDGIDNEVEKIARKISEIQNLDKKIGKIDETSFFSVISSTVNIGLSIYNFSNNLVNETQNSTEKINKIVDEMLADKSNGEREVEKGLLVSLVGDAIERKMNNTKK